MKCDDEQTSPWSKTAHRGVQCPVQQYQFLIDAHADRLKRARRWMRAAMATESGLNAACQIARASEWCLTTALDDQLHDATGLRLFTELAQCLQDLHLTGFVNKIRSGHDRIRAHSHIKRAVFLKRKPALRAIELMR